MCMAGFRELGDGECDSGEEATGASFGVGGARVLTPRGSDYRQVPLFKLPEADRQGLFELQVCPALHVGLPV